MKTIVILLLVIMTSCSFGTNMIKENRLFRTKEYIGVYDTCWFHKGGFMVSPSVLVRMQDDTYICIYGKKCEFERGDWIYVKYEYWNSVMAWKRFITDLREIHKYVITE